MAITDLTNTTWVLNSRINISDTLYYCNYIAKSGNYVVNGSALGSQNANYWFLFNGSYGTYPAIYFDREKNNWRYTVDNYGSEVVTSPTVTFTGGTDATNATLISWLQSNATLQVTDIVVNSTTLETTLHTAGKYCDKNILVKSSDSNLTAENIKKDVSVFGVTGTYEGTDVSDTTATQGDVLSGKYFYGSDGVKTEGTMTDHTETSITLNAGTGDQYVPAGHYSDILTKLVLNSDAASKIKQGEVILGVTGSYAGGGGSPIEVATETEMANILSSATADDNGKIYRYTGTTGTYVNGALYYLEVQK